MTAANSSPHISSSTLRAAALTVGCGSASSGRSASTASRPPATAAARTAAWRTSHTSSRSKRMSASRRSRRGSCASDCAAATRTSASASSKSVSAVPLWSDGVWLATSRRTSGLGSRRADRSRPSASIAIAHRARTAAHRTPTSRSNSRGWHAVSARASGPSIARDSSAHRRTPAIPRRAHRSTAQARGRLRARQARSRRPCACSTSGRRNLESPSAWRPCRRARAVLQPTPAPPRDPPRAGARAGMRFRLALRRAVAARAPRTPHHVTGHQRRRGARAAPPGNPAARRRPATAR